MKKISRKKFNKLMRAHFTKNMRKSFGADELYLDNCEADPYLTCNENRVHVIAFSYAEAWEAVQKWFNIA